MWYFLSFYWSQDSSQLLSSASHFSPLVYSDCLCHSHPLSSHTPFFSSSTYFLQKDECPNEGSEVLLTLLLLIAPWKFGWFWKVSSVAFSSIYSGLVAVTQCLIMGTDRHWANLSLSSQTGKANGCLEGIQSFQITFLLTKQHNSYMVSFYVFIFEVDFQWIWEVTENKQKKNQKSPKGNM